MFYSSQPLGFRKVDLPDAYRGVPLRQDDSRAAIVAVWDPKMHAWFFAESRAMLFGFFVERK